ncbi:MAG: MarR family transcriptional regulator [Candidatus Woesearchaeota archaeon]
MKNKIVGIIIIFISILIGFIIYSFDKALEEIHTMACSHGNTCPMLGSLEVQTKISITIMIFVIVIGLYLIFFGKEEKIVREIKTIKEQIEPRNITLENYEKFMHKLNPDEKGILTRIIESKGTIFQSEIVEKTDFSKVKITRVLDKLEGMGIIERKRRGMTNVVILKH